MKMLISKSQRRKQVIDLKNFTKLILKDNYNLNCFNLHIFCKLGGELIFKSVNSLGFIDGKFETVSVSTTH